MIPKIKGKKSKIKKGTPRPTEIHDPNHAKMQREMTMLAAARGLIKLPQQAWKPGEFDMKIIDMWYDILQCIILRKLDTCTFSGVIHIFRSSSLYQTVPSGKLWTSEEDAIVLQHCSAEKNFSNWSGLATKHLPDRTGKQIRDVSSITFRCLSVKGIHPNLSFISHDQLLPSQLSSSFLIAME